MKTAYIQLPDKTRRHQVDVLREHKDEAGNVIAYTVRRRNGEEWQVKPDDLLVSRVQEIANGKAALRGLVVDTVRLLMQAGATYEEARDTAASNSGMSRKSVGRYFKAWEKHPI